MMGNGIKKKRTFIQARKKGQLSATIFHVVGVLILFFRNTAGTILEYSEREVVIPVGDTMWLVVLLLKLGMRAR